MSKQPTSGVIYRGPSMIDGAPIVVVATFPKVSGANRKTGAVLQTYILRADVAPIEAIRQGADVSICGDCKHRGDGATYATRSCYVNVAQGPTVVYKAAQRGAYPDVSDPESREGDAARVALGRGRVVRLGTYGDPAAVPAYVWLSILAESTAHTGYTHAWRNPAAAALRSVVMASVDTADEAAAAQSAGWRTFRVRMADEPTLPREFVCPASDEGGKRVTCAQCKACGGADGRKGSPVIIAHGALAAKLPANRARSLPLA